MEVDTSCASDNLSIRVRRTLDDLAVIRHDLLAISKESTADGSAQCLDLELAGELKSVVDAIRLLLWAYIKALAGKSGRDPAEVLSWYKMDLAVEMLRSLRNRNAQTPDSDSRFQHLVNQALETVAHSGDHSHSH